MKAAYPQQLVIIRFFSFNLELICINVTVPSGISNNSDYGNKTTEDTVWRNGGNTTPQSA